MTEHRGAGRPRRQRPARPRPVAEAAVRHAGGQDREHDAVGIVRRLLEPLPSGSCLAMPVGAADVAPDEVGRVAREYAARGMPMRLRTHAEAAEFFAGLDLAEPGVVQVHKWRPNRTDGTESGGESIRDEDIAMYGAVAHKP